MSVEMNQVLAQMRAMSIAAQDGVSSERVQALEGADFAQITGAARKASGARSDHESAAQ